MAWTLGGRSRQWRRERTRPPSASTRRVVGGRLARSGVRSAVDPAAGGRGADTRRGRGTRQRLPARSSVGHEWASASPS